MTVSATTGPARAAGVADEPPLTRTLEGATLSPLARLLLWDYPRGSLAYDLMIVALILVLLLFPVDWWNDPMVLR